MGSLRYTGAAQALKQITTIAASDTWAQGDTATVTINKKSVTITLGSSAATTDVVASLAAAINATGTDLTDGLADDETRNVNGQTIPEFQEVVASASSSTLTLTSFTAGVPFTVTASETTNGDGAMGIPSTTQAATGPGDLGNADNYDTGSLPQNSDNLYIDNLAVDINDGLADLSSVTLSLLVIGNNFTGTIGRAKTNDGGYPEYRGDYMQIGATACQIGIGDGTGSGRIKINFGSVQTATIVTDTGSSLETSLGAVQLLGTNASNTLEVNDGSVSVASYGSEASTFATVLQSGGTLRLGAGCTLTTVTKTDGTLTVHSAMTTYTQYSGTTTVAGSGAVTTSNVNGGTALWHTSGTVGTMNVGLSGDNAVVDCSGDPSSRTFTTTNLKRGGQIVDPSGTITYTNGIAKAAGVRSVTAA